jgi:hypothetical protein
MVKLTVMALDMGSPAKFNRPTGVGAPPLAGSPPVK